MGERKIQQQILLQLGNGDVRLFRQNVGQAWTGEVISKGEGHIILRNPRPLHAGLCKGSSDLIGWRTMVITPDMVGQRVAVFAAVEVKDRGRPSADQMNFINAVAEAGGLAGVARSVEEAQSVLGYGVL